MTTLGDVVRTDEPFLLRVVVPLLLVAAFPLVPAPCGAAGPEPPDLKRWALAIEAGSASLSSEGGLTIEYFDRYDTYTTSLRADIEDPADFRMAGAVRFRPIDLRFDVGGQFEDLDLTTFHAGVGRTVKKWGNRGTWSLGLALVAGAGNLSGKIGEVPLGAETGSAFMLSPLDSEGRGYEIPAGSDFDISVWGWDAEALAEMRYQASRLVFLNVTAGYRYGWGYDDPDLKASWSVDGGDREVEIPLNFSNESGQYSRTTGTWDIDTSGVVLRFGLGWTFGDTVTR